MAAGGGPLRLLLLLAAATAVSAESAPDLRVIVGEVVDDARQQLIDTVGFCKNSTAPFQCVAARGECEQGEEPITVRNSTFCQDDCPHGFLALVDTGLVLCTRMKKKL